MKCPHCGGLINRNLPDQRKKAKNNVSGFKGVYQNNGLTWSAEITFKGKKHYLGSFSNPQAANSARKLKGITYLTSLKGFK